MMLSLILTTAAVTGRASFEEDAKYELHAVFDAEAVEDAPQVGPQRREPDPERGRDLLVAHAPQDALNCPRFLRRQTEGGDHARPGRSVEREGQGRTGGLP